MSRSATQAYKSALEEKEQHDLVVKNLPFVRHVLGRLVGRLPSHVDLENLEAAGVLGLVEASHQFDPERGVGFRSFAYQRIWGAIVDEMRRSSPLPQRVMNRISKIMKVKESMTPPVTVEKLAEACEFTAEEVEQCLLAMSVSNPIGFRDEALRHSDPTDEPVGYQLEQEELRSKLADAIEELPERQRLVVTMYYAEDLRLKEIGRVLNLSESRVSRILAAAELRLRELTS